MPDYRIIRRKLGCIEEYYIEHWYGSTSRWVRSPFSHKSFEDAKLIVQELRKDDLKKKFIEEAEETVWWLS